MPPVPSDTYADSYIESDSTYGWEHHIGRVINGQLERYTSDIIRKNVTDPNLSDHVYIITLNCDEHRISMVNENNKTKDDIQIDTIRAPFPWCFFVEHPRSGWPVSLI